MPPIPKKTFNIPFSGGAVTVVCLYKSTVVASVVKSIISVQYNADGTTVTFGADSTSSLSPLEGSSVKICAICGRIYNKKVLCIPRIPWEAFHSKKK